MAQKIFKPRELLLLSGRDLTRSRHPVEERPCAIPCSSQCLRVCPSTRWILLSPITAITCDDGDPN